MKTLFAIFIALSPSLAFASPTIYSQFKKTYPNSTVLNIFKCKVCHTGSMPNLNPYGLDLQKMKIDFKAIEQLDSDGDGFSNIVEINVGTNPGDPNSHSTPYYLWQ